MLFDLPQVFWKVEVRRHYGRDGIDRSHVSRAGAPSHKRSCERVQKKISKILHLYAKSNNFWQVLLGAKMSFSAPESKFELQWDCQQTQIKTGASDPS